MPSVAADSLCLDRVLMPGTGGDSQHNGTISGGLPYLERRGTA